jgi:hypothetical protein
VSVETRQQAAQELGAVATNAMVAPVSLDAAKNQCMDLGIKPQTEAFVSV